MNYVHLVKLPLYSRCTCANQKIPAIEKEPIRSSSIASRPIGDRGDMTSLLQLQLEPACNLIGGSYGRIEICLARFYY